MGSESRGARCTGMGLLHTTQVLHPAACLSASVSFVGVVLRISPGSKGNQWAYVNSTLSGTCTPRSAVLVHKWLRPAETSVNHTDEL